jgi:anti-sigma factor RsiW
MSLTEDKFEILIGKCLDGQATPMERHLFEKEMNQNPRAKEMFEHWQTLNEWGRGLAVDTLAEQGACPEEVFEQAWRRSRGVLWFRLARSQRHMRFAVGVAAGFLLGVLLHFVWMTGTTNQNVSPRTVAQNTVVQTEGGRKVVNPDVIAASASDRETLAGRSESRNVNSYIITDAAGNRYLVQQGVQQQRLQEGNIRRAAYSL